MVDFAQTNSFLHQAIGEKQFLIAWFVLIVPLWGN